jgi:hypothetical protein
MVIIKYVPTDAMGTHVLIRPTLKTGYFTVSSYTNLSYNQATNLSSFTIAEINAYGARQHRKLPRLLTW